MLIALVRPIAVACVLVVVAESGIRAARVERSIDTTAFAVESIQANPRELRAAQWLGTRAAGPGAATRSRIRFEWDQVFGARAYALSGRWTDSGSASVQSVEYHVAPRNATYWGERRVEFDVTLPSGRHSWRVVALFAPTDTGDFENATRLTFQLR
jgi:hypothetical protein